MPVARHPGRRRTSPRARPRTSGSTRAPGRWPATADVLVAPTGQRAVATLADVLGPELLCAHCVHVDGRTRSQLLAAHDVPVAHCPRSNALLGCGIAPLAELRAAGVRVGLGTDSPASTPSFDAWEELRTAVYMSRARERRPDALDADDALRLATLDAARALGLDDEIGSLTPGQAGRPNRRSRSPEARTIRSRIQQSLPFSAARRLASSRRSSTEAPVTAKERPRGKRYAAPQAPPDSECCA